MQPETPAIPPRKIGSTTFPGLSQTGEGWCFQFLGCPSVPNPPAGKSKLDSPRSESDRGRLLLGFDLVGLCVTWKGLGVAAGGWGVEAVPWEQGARGAIRSAIRLRS